MYHKPKEILFILAVLLAVGFETHFFFANRQAQCQQIEQLKEKAKCDSLEKAGWKMLYQKCKHP